MTSIWIVSDKNQPKAFQNHGRQLRERWLSLFSVSRSTGDVRYTAKCSFSRCYCKMVSAGMYIR